MKNVKWRYPILFAGWLAVAAPSLPVNAAPGWLGLMVRPPEGVQVTELIKDGPADKAGLQKGDVIIAVDGRKVVSASGFQAIISRLVPDTEVTLTLLRGGDETTVNAIVAGRTTHGSTHPGPMYGWREPGYLRGPFAGMYRGPEPYAPFPWQHFMGVSKPWLGISMESRTSGILVTHVTANSPAEKAGLQRDDIITAVDGAAVTGPDDLVYIIHRHRPGDKLELAIQRSGEDRKVSVELGTPPTGPRDPA